MLNKNYSIPASKRTVGVHKYFTQLNPTVLPLSMGVLAKNAKRTQLARKSSRSFSSASDKGISCRATDSVSGEELHN